MNTTQHPVRDVVAIGKVSAFEAPAQDSGTAPAEVGLANTYIHRLACTNCRRSEYASGTTPAHCPSAPNEGR
jgi:hypothetical protein